MRRWACVLCAMNTIKGTSEIWNIHTGFQTEKSDKLGYNVNNCSVCKSDHISYVLAILLAAEVVKPLFYTISNCIRLSKEDISWHLGDIGTMILRQYKQHVTYGYERTQWQGCLPIANSMQKLDETMQQE